MRTSCIPRARSRSTELLVCSCKCLGPSLGPGQAVLDIHQPGPADSAVAFWAPRILRPAEATPELVREACQETGAWEEHELEDDEENWLRVVWMSACDIGDSDEPYSL
jgi:hypothetical protein